LFGDDFIDLCLKVHKQKTMKKSSTTLNTTNAQHLIYENGLLTIDILGGIKLDGLDRMRVTLKIQAEHLTLRHNLDLYNDTQVEKLVRKAAEKLEVGTSVTAAALMDLTDKLEGYRLTELERTMSADDKRKILSPEEVKEAKLYLSSPNLMQRTKEDIGKAGVIGEEDNRLLMYLIFSSRKRESPLHVISLGSSGIGKTHLQEKVAQLIPKEDKIEATGLSDMALYYYGQTELRNKLLLFEDLDGALNAFFPIRELQTKTKITRPVVHKNTRGESKTVNLVVEGPVSIAGCTTKESLYEDNANRSFLIYIDESGEQDERIMNYQRKLSAGKVDVAEEYKIAEILQNTQRVLQPVQVRNPFAEYLKLPNEVFKPRRTNAHYLAFIEVVTFYHQYQREKQYDQDTASPNSEGGRGEEYIETTLEDIAEANTLMKSILLRKSDELTGACRDYLESLKKWMEKESKTAFTNKEVRQGLRVKHSNQKRYMGQLQQYGYINRATGDQKNGYSYEIVSYEEYEQLKAGIGNALDNVLIELEKQFSSPQAVQKQNEPLKSKKTSKITK